MTNSSSPVTLANFYNPGAFTHKTWLSTDNKTLFTTDEVNGGYLASFDISNFGNISQLDTFLTDPRSGVIVHNIYIVRKNNNDYAVTSWYKDGIVITDAARPGNLVQVGNYDTSPLSGGGYGGCWGVYPYLPSGNILASDIETGLYVLTPTYTRACYLEGKITNCQNGNPVAGVKVEIQLVTPIGNSNIDITDLNGNYRVGIGAPGNYIVNYSKTGFINYSDTVSMSQGILNIHNVQLCPDGINEYENLAEVKISPNPFSEFAEMKITGEKISVTGSQLKIVDVYGKQMKTFRVESSSMKIERENFPAGMYFYSITNSGEIIARGKFMVE